MICCLTLNLSSSSNAWRTRGRHSHRCHRPSHIARCSCGGGGACWPGPRRVQRAQAARGHAACKPPKTARARECGQRERTGSRAVRMQLSLPQRTVCPRGLALRTRRRRADDVAARWCDLPAVRLRCVPSRIQGGGRRLFCVHSPHKSPEQLCLPARSFKVSDI